MRANELSSASETAVSLEFATFPLVARDLDRFNGTCTANPLVTALLDNVQGSDRTSRVLVVDGSCLCRNSLFCGAAWRCDLLEWSELLRRKELVVEVESAAHKQELESFTAEGYRQQANRRLGTDRIQRVTIKLKR